MTYWEVFGLLAGSGVWLGLGWYLHLHVRGDGVGCEMKFVMPHARWFWTSDTRR